MIQGGTAGRRPHLVVVGIAGLAALITALLTTLVGWALVVVWGYIGLGVALGIVACAGLGVVILLRGRQERSWSKGL